MMMVVSRLLVLVVVLAPAHAGEALRVEIGGDNICRRLRDLTQGITGRIKKRHSGRVECSTGVPLPDPILIATV